VDDRHHENAASFARAQGRADEARLLAARAEVAAVRAERRSRQGPAGTSERWARVAAIHRSTEQRHLASARLNAVYATRLRQSMEQPGASRAAVFLEAVATVAKGTAVVFTVSGCEQTEALVAASDAVARAASDLERAYGEGPATDAVARGGLVHASGELAWVWPLYGRAADHLGIHAVSAAPLRLHGRCFGSVTAMDAHPDGPDSGLPADQLADALVSNLLARDVPADGDGLPALPLFDGDQAVMHQAAGMVAAQSGADVADALAMLRARAFAEGQPVVTIAAHVVRRELQISVPG
jgi:hypothetical protein